MGRNLCKLHPQWRQASALAETMKILCNRLGKAGANTGDVLVLFEGRNFDEPRLCVCGRVFCLLSRASWSPKFQDWTMCEPNTAQDMGGASVDFPLEVRLSLAPLKLRMPFADSAIGLHHETSDDLALNLISRARSWRLRVCKYDLLSAMAMRVTGLEPAAEFDLQVGMRGARPDRAATGQRVDTNILAIQALCDLGDPLADAGREARCASVGRRGAGTQSQGLQYRAPGHGASTAPGPDELLRPHRQGRNRNMTSNNESGDDSTEDEVCLASLLEQPLEMNQGLVDLADGLLIPEVEEHIDLLAPGCPIDCDEPPAPVFRTEEAAAGVAASSAQGTEAAGERDLPAAPADMGSAAEALVEFGHVVELAASADGPQRFEANASAAPPPPQQPPVEEQPPQYPPIPDGPEGWTMSPHGYVFGGGRYRGRITCFGSNVSVKCAAHGCGKLKGRKKITDGQLAQWLARGDEECQVDASATRDAMARRHVAMFPL